MSGDDPYIVGYNDGWHKSGMRWLSPDTASSYAHQYNSGYNDGCSARRQQDISFGKLEQGWLFSEY